MLLILVPLVNLIIELMLLFRGPAPASDVGYGSAEPRQVNIYNSPGAGPVGHAASQPGHVEQINPHHICPTVMSMTNGRFDPEAVIKRLAVSA